MARIPIACTLTVEEQPTRIAEWRTLVARATGRRRGERGVELSFPPDLGPAVADLASREKHCCGFFEFAVTTGADAVVLSISAPAEARPLVDAFYDMAPPTTTT